MGNAIGPDVSFYQDDPTTPAHIDFAKMNRSADYVIIRAGQNLWPDRDFPRNWAAAKAAGLPRGSYWFYDSRADPKRQAELWVDTMDGDLGELPMFADFEEAYGGQFKGWRNWYNFLERLKELVDQKEIAIYTAFYYWRDNAPNPNTQAQNLEYFHQYPLWIANYGVTTPSVPKPWGANEWLFWQFTEVGDGNLYGVESKGIDLNYFNGDVEAFRQRFGLGETPPVSGEKFRVELRIREGPSMEEDEVGMLQQNEIVEVLDTAADDTWMQVKRADGTTGWIFHTHLIEVEPTPPPPPPGDKWYRVTATKLNVRSGPGTNFEDIGDLFRGEVVQALDYAENNTWIKILRKSDGLTGWCSADFLEETTAPPDGEPPPTGEIGWYRVTASALNVRQEPNTSATVVGSLPFNSVVKGVEKNADESWIKIFRESDNLTGWCSANFLEETENPNDGGEPPPPVSQKNWYQVKASTLNVRSGPSTSDEKVGTLTQGQIVLLLEANEDKTWVRVQRFDGLVGWCAVSYLTDLGTTAPEKLTQKIFNGVTYFRQEMQSPRKMVAHVLAVDMRATGLKSLVTPPSHASGLICTRRTSKFLEEFGLQIAINGDGFSYPDQNEFPPSQYCPNGGEPVDVNSYAASRGTVYSQRWESRPILYINKNNEVSFNQPSGAVFNAISGDRMLVDKGKRAANLESQSVEPRTAVGLNQNGRWLFMVVIDGRQAGYSQGATFPELADFMISLGSYTALNLDGGGSSAIVIESVMGGPFVLNSPIEGMIPGNEAEVANHLGFWVNK